jgi:hypothetical protein
MRRCANVTISDGWCNFSKVGDANWRAVLYCNDNRTDFIERMKLA